MLLLLFFCWPSLSHVIWLGYSLPSGQSRIFSTQGYTKGFKVWRAPGSLEHFSLEMLPCDMWLHGHGVGSLVGKAGSQISQEAPARCVIAGHPEGEMHWKWTV